MPGSEGAEAETIERRAVDAALAIAGEVGWDQVRLTAVADRAGLPLAEVGRRFRDVDAVAIAWFAQARLAMLATPAQRLAGLPTRSQSASGSRAIAVRPTSWACRSRPAPGTRATSSRSWTSRGRL